MSNQNNTTQTNATAGLPAETQIRAVFEVQHAGRKQTLFVKKDRVVFGSVDSSDIKLSGSKIAPIHAVMELKFGANESVSEARILDLASPAGITVNGVRVVNQIVKSGDLITVGDAIIRFGFKKPEMQNPLPDQALLLIDASEVKTIFDYRPPVKEALEVVYSWNQSILNVKHYTGGNKGNVSVTLGGTDTQDFLVPPVFSSGGDFTLASQSGNSWTIYLDPKMRGVLYVGGELIAVEKFPQRSVTLGENDFAKIEAGTVDFYLSQTVSPPVMRSQTQLISDPFLAKSLLVSLILSAVVMVTMSQLVVPPAEVEQVPETIATILYHPEKYSIKKPIPQPKNQAKVEPKPPEPEKPKKQVVDFTKPQEKTGKVAQTKSPQPGKKQSAQNAGHEGEGARAKGAEGSRGAKTKNQGKPQTAANRPSPQAGNDRGGTVSQAADNGNVQMMKGATNKILDLLGGSGEKLGKSGSKLQGFGGFSTAGNGGLAMQGSGKGGGGNADTLLGGLGDKGRGGGKVGTGLGAEGTGSGIVGGKTRVELNVGGGEETVVVGAIDRDAIDAAIRAHKDEFRYCYERELNAGHPKLVGKVLTAFVIGGSGRASQLAIATSSMNDANVERCILGVLSRIQFPQPAGGVPVTIKYPFGYADTSK
jgi:hypothetical protein